MSALTIIDQAWALVSPARDGFDQVSANKSISFEREAGFAVQVLTASTYALDTAKKNPQSVINAVTNISAIGISLNPAKKQAYLVPRDGRICLDISYMGLIDLATDSNAIRWAQAAVVHRNDTFSLNGFDRAPTHHFNPFATDRGEIVGVYTVAKTADGDFLTHAMSIDSVFDIRDRSAAWKAYVAKQTKCPWVTDEAEMVKKTCIKQASKTWPRNAADGLSRAIEHLNTDGGEGLGFEPTPEVAAQPEIKMPVRRPALASQAAGNASDAVPAAPRPTQTPAPATNDRPATEGEKAHIKNKAGNRLNDLLSRCGLDSMDGLTSTQFAKLRNGLKELA